MRCLAVVLGVVAVLEGAILTAGPSPAPNQVASVDWWFDQETHALCWDGRTSVGYSFFVDLDGVHETAVKSTYDLDPRGFVVLAGIALGLGVSGYPGLNGNNTALSSSDINPPVPHFRYPLSNPYPPEWYHLFVTRLTPPTDYVWGLQGSDGARVQPIMRPFWTSSDRGRTWQEVDPSSLSSGRSCAEAAQGSVSLRVEPRTLNLGSRGRWIEGEITVKDAQAADVSLVSLTLNSVPAARAQIVSNTTIRAKFGRADVEATLGPGDSARVVLAGSWIGGIPFLTTDEIRVIRSDDGK